MLKSCNLNLDYNNPHHDGVRYHIETSLLICRANQWTGFNIITAFVMKEIINENHIYKNRSYNLLLE